MAEELMQETARLFREYVELTSDEIYPQEPVPVRARVIDAPEPCDVVDVGDMDFDDIEVSVIEADEWPGNTELTITFWAMNSTWSVSFYPMNDTGLYVVGSDLEEVLKCARDALSKRIAFLLGNMAICTADIDAELIHYLEGGIDACEEE